MQARGPTARETEERYAAEMKPLAFSTVRGLIKKINMKTLISGGKAPASSTGKRMKRIKAELSSLITDLPIFSGGSVFVRVDEDRIDCMKFLITGPEGTPYESGCFEFDCVLPVDYPNGPPKIQITTTNGGMTRFNPNLYADGKGERGEEEGERANARTPAHTYARARAHTYHKSSVLTFRNCHLNPHTIPQVCLSLLGRSGSE